MENNVFTRELTYLEKLPIEGKPDEWEYKPTKKTAAFYELSRTDKRQHKLHALILSFVRSGSNSSEDDIETKFKIDSDLVLELGVRGFNTLFVKDHPDNGMDVTDKSEFLIDGGAVSTWAFWFLQEKVLPFFPVLIGSSSV